MPIIRRIFYIVEVFYLLNKTVLIYLLETIFIIILKVITYCINSICLIIQLNPLGWWLLSRYTDNILFYIAAQDVFVVNKD